MNPNQDPIVDDDEIDKKNNTLRQAQIDEAKETYPAKEIFTIESYKAIRGTKSTAGVEMDLDSIAEEIEYDYYVIHPEVETIRDYVRMKFETQDM